jgi:hypothetical protein
MWLRTSKPKRQEPRNPMAAILTKQHIDSVIQGLPIQGRIMLHLLMLGYFEVPQEEIEYMAVDRPDPRMAAGMKRIVSVISREALQGIADRVAQYQSQARLKRERMWLQGECLGRQIARWETFIAVAERLLITRFGMTPDSLKDLQTQARSAILRPVVRDLNARWERNEISEDDYRQRRLAAEYQTLLRKVDRDRKRYDIAKRELQRSSSVPLQDHEIAHIWGIPAGSLAARKVKYLKQYLDNLQAEVLRGSSATESDTAAPRDYWKESFIVLAQGPVERSVAPYDGLEHTEQALLEKLLILASGTLPEDLEGRFWLPVSLSLFTLQRLAAIQSEWDLSPDAVEQELLDRIAPTPKVLELSEEEKAQLQLGEMGEHVLRSMLGEEKR